VPSPSIVTVTAVSNQDPTSSDSASVSITAAPASPQAPAQPSSGGGGGATDVAALLCLLVVTLRRRQNRNSAAAPRLFKSPASRSADCK
jgi:hypothetical protein